MTTQEQETTSLLCRAGDFGNRALLLGAGFSKNFGGFLGSEMWAALLNFLDHESAPRSAYELRTADSYEEAIENIRFVESFEPERSFLEDAIVRAYEWQEEQFRSRRRDLQLQTWRELIQPLTKQPETSFIFTINQDLAFERYGAMNIVCGRPIQIPANTPEALTETVGYGTRPAFERNGGPLMPTAIEPPACDLPNFFETSKGAVNYVKLHGSIHWKGDHVGGRLLITRGPQNKEEDIRKSRLLSVYTEAFEAVCMSKGVDLWVVGYGFGDADINRILCTGIEHAGLRLHIVDPSPLSTKKKEIIENFGRKERRHRYDPIGMDIWHSVVEYFQCDLERDIHAFSAPSMLNLLRDVLRKLEQA